MRDRPRSRAAAPPRSPGAPVLLRSPRHTRRQKRRPPVSNCRRASPGWAAQPGGHRGRPSRSPRRRGAWLPDSRLSSCSTVRARDQRSNRDDRDPHLVTLLGNRRPATHSMVAAGIAVAARWAGPADRPSSSRYDRGSLPPRPRRGAIAVSGRRRGRRAARVVAVMRPARDRRDRPGLPGGDEGRRGRVRSRAGTRQ